MKTEDEHFRDWESHVFGYGYGTGEKPVLTALQDFFDLCDGYNYDHSVLEKIIGPTITWLLINTLAHADMIEYGISALYGWMTQSHGRALADFVRAHSTEQLVSICTDYDESYSPCYPDHCSCDDEECTNPFWRNRRPK